MCPDEVVDVAPRVIPSTQLSTDTAQSTGIVRSAAIDHASVGAERVWMGRATCLPKMMSEPHHHSEAETGSYIMSGRFRVYYGDGYTQWVEYGPGDFCFIPAYMPHIEVNPYDEPAEVIFTRSPDNIVVTLPPTDFSMPVV